MTSHDTEPAAHFVVVQPDAYDRAYGQAEGFPHTRPSTVTVSNTMGVGGVRSYIVQTFRPPEMGDSLFIVITGPDGLQRIHLPAEVTEKIARQRDALNTQSRRRAGKARAAADKRAGIVPGFMRAHNKAGG